MTVLSGTGNTILQDQIYGNTMMPIELGTSGLNPNTPGGPHSGPNDLQNYPTITSALQGNGSTQVQGYLNSASNTRFTIETYYLSSSGSLLLNSQQVTTDAQGNAAITPFSLILPNGTPAGGTIEGTATDPSGNTSEYGLALAPAQIRTAYGINKLSLDGSRQTIAIIALNNDPKIFDELDAFDLQFGTTNSGQSLYSQYGAATSDVTMLAYDPNGNAINPSTLPTTTSLEEAMDVEWAHAIAPGAHIVVVESSDFFAAIRAAGTLPNVSVVSISYAYNEAGAPQPTTVTLPTITDPQEQQNDPAFMMAGLTFLAASGDYGKYGKAYPAFSPTAVAVGGTVLTLNPDGTYRTEQGWGDGAKSAADGGSGGGVSLFEKEPAFQLGVQQLGKRTIPDVALIGGTDVAVAVLPDGLAGNPGWISAAGTSLATPLWAGLLALVNQGRADSGNPVLNSASPQETLIDLYSLPPGDYHNNLGGSNGNTTTGLVNVARYNEVTGLGTPIANQVVPDLINMTVLPTPILQAMPTDSVLLGTFSTANGAPYTASVKWGDGTSNTSAGANSPLRIAVSGQFVQVFGSHAFTKSGLLTVTVMLTDSQGVAAKHYAAAQVATDVSGRVRVSRSQLTINWVAGTATGTISITNTSTAAISGSLIFVWKNMVAGVSVQSVSVTIKGVTTQLAVSSNGNGNQQVLISSQLLAKLAVNQKITLNVIYSDPTLAAVTFVPGLFSDPFDE